MSPDSLIDGLNPQQQAAVTHQGSPLLVVAGAGSGKTRVLTRRIAYLLGQRGVNPYEVLAITFTNTSTAGTPMTYLWTFSDGTTSTLQNPTHVFSPAGIYSFSLDVITNQNCIDTSQITSVNSITVNPTPIATLLLSAREGILAVLFSL